MAAKKRAMSSTGKSSTSRVKTEPRPAEPSGIDPMSELTRNRRVWSAYIEKGYSRADFARALGAQYTSVDRWDRGVAVMSLEALEKASALLGYSMDELCFGKDARVVAVGSTPSVRERDKPLDDEGILEALNAINANSAQRAALGEHRASPAGKYQTFTRSYVECFCNAYAELESEHGHEYAMIHAPVQAVRARAVAGVVAKRGRAAKR